MEQIKRLCIIPCGVAKIWDKQPDLGAVEAQHVYTGVLAAACQRYARSFFDDWVILSAKHGFLYPQDLISEDYNVSFVKPSRDTITNQQLNQQAQAKGLDAYQHITVLGGRHYTERVKPVFNTHQELLFPLSGCKGIGYMLQKVTQAVESQTEISEAHTISNEGSELKSSAVAKETKIIEASPLQEYSGKYQQLYRYLTAEEADSLTLSMKQLEVILQFSLPESAYVHRPWWANTLSHSHAKSWLMAGWEVSSVSLGERVLFKKML